MNLGMVRRRARVILDTNILISAFIYEGKPGQIFKLVLEKKIRAVTSSVLLSELQETLIKKFNFSEEKIKQINRLMERFILVYPQKQLSVIRDEDDDRVLEAAIEGGCDFIITGDKDLLDLGGYKEIKIVTADEFLNIFQQ